MIPGVMPEDLEITIRRVDPAAIDPDDTFALSAPWRLPPRLLESVARAGVLTPLEAEPLGGGRYRLVDGFGRLAAARRLGLGEVPLAEAPPLDPLERFVRRLESRLASRPLDELEQGRAAARLVRRFRVPESEMLEKFLPLLGVRGQRVRLQRLLSLAGIPERLQRALPRLQPDIALGLSRWDAPEQELFLGLLERYCPGVNHQKELFQALDELRQAAGVPGGVLGVWRESGAGRVDTEEARPAAERLSAIRAAIRRARYPTLSAMEGEAEQLRSALRVPPEIQLQWPRFFEGDRITVRFSFRSAEEFESLSRRLAEMAGRNELRRLLELL